MLQKLIDFIKKLFGIQDKQETQTTKKTVKKQVDKKSYEPKKLLTTTEIRFKNAIEKFIPSNYILYPQINLASIIKRTDEHKYQNELYRNVDFCIFDDKYNPKIIIEINDNSHKEKSRRARDIKVQNICNNANIPIINFWTDYGVNESYIERKIQEVLNKD